MPCTPCLRTSSAIANASIMDVFFSQFSSSLSLGTTTRESTYFLRNPIPCSACAALFFPSNENGLVTTPTVRMPMSFAALAMIGAAPVPVPPPMPAVMNTMSLPSMMSTIVSIVSSADCCPISGFPPAPSPLVSFSPIWILFSALHFFSACLSVFTAMYSTPARLVSIMRLTALHPPPPTPMTFSTAELSGSVSNCNMSIPSLFPYILLVYSTISKHKFH